MARRRAPARGDGHASRRLFGERAAQARALRRAAVGRGGVHAAAATAAHMPTGAWTSYGEALRAPIGPIHWAGSRDRRGVVGLHGRRGARRARRAAREVLGRAVSLDAVIDRRRPQRPDGRGLPGARRAVGAGARAPRHRRRRLRDRGAVARACARRPGAYTLSLLRPEIMRDLDLAAPRPAGGGARALPVRAVSRRAQGGHLVRAASARTPSSSATGRAPTPTATRRSPSAGSGPPSGRGR